MAAFINSPNMYAGNYESGVSQKLTLKFIFSFIVIWLISIQFS